MSSNTNLLNSITNSINDTINTLEDAFFEIDIAILQCPDIKSFTSKFASNIDILKSHIKQLKAINNSFNLSSGDNNIVLDTINYQQLNRLSINKQV